MSKPVNLWGDRAACRGTDPELFYPLGEIGPPRRQIWEAKQVCQACHVQWTCLTWALLHGVTEGIWGGSTASERRAMLDDEAALEQRVASSPRQWDGRRRQRA